MLHSDGGTAMTQEVSVDGPVELGRRRVLLGAGAAGLAGVLVACGGDDGATEDPADTAPGPDTTTDDDGDTATDDDTGDDDGDDADDDEGEPLASTADVPVGDGVIVADQGVVITQPEEGEFRAFSSTCTHEGCPVGAVSDGLIRCPCHGSRFHIDDGSVENGPATSPLPEVQIRVDGDRILRA
jgi:Rieske Fe-S protein